MGTGASHRGSFPKSCGPFGAPSRRSLFRPRPWRARRKPHSSYASGKEIPKWVNVRTGEVDGKLVEVFGDVREGDEVAVRGTDELRPGTRVTAHVAAAEQPPSSK